MEVGELKRGKELGYASNPYNKYIWAKCEECDNCRWVLLHRGKPFSAICQKCSDIKKGIKRRIMFRGKGNPNWKDDGRYQRPDGGYVEIILNPNDFFHPMADGKRHVKEHRLVMAKHLGRNLHRWEIVHHINHIKDDNRIENLQLVSDLGHRQLTILEEKIDKQGQMIGELHKEIKLLRWQLKEMQATVSWR